jgi:hypothetical protein
MDRIIDGQGALVAKNGRCFLETDSMLFRIRRGFLSVPLEGQGHYRAVLRERNSLGKGEGSEG